MNAYQICNRCVMDTTDPNIVFDEKGYCNHCTNVLKKKKEYPFCLNNDEKKKELEGIIAQIKKAGTKKYDCIVGVSGGVDSSYLIYIITKMGLKPLAVHLDNGWNSELATSNIENLCKKLDVDLFTYVINWNEFRDIQLSFLKASTPDAEIPTDHAISAILYAIAVKYGLKYIVSGDNFNTESILPVAWSHGHNDWKYIREIHKRFGSVKMKTFPRSSYFKLFYYTFVKKIKIIKLLNFVDYNKDVAVQTIKNELGWKPYEGKHHESIYTKFFQSYILPKKFNFDKRKAHLSSLICSGQIDRKRAIIELKKETFLLSKLNENKEYVSTKLGIGNSKFDDIMNAKIKTFWDYPSYENSWYYKLVRILYRFLKKK